MTVLPQVPNYLEVSAIIQRYLHDALLQKIGAQAAMDAAAAEVNDLVGAQPAACALLSAILPWTQFRGGETQKNRCSALAAAVYSVSNGKGGSVHHSINEAS